MIRYWYILVYVLLYIDSLYICIYEIFSKKLYSPNIESSILVLPECIILSSLLFTWKYVHLCPVLCFIFFFSFYLLSEYIAVFFCENSFIAMALHFCRKIFRGLVNKIQTLVFFCIFNFLVNTFFLILIP